MRLIDEANRRNILFAINTYQYIHEIRDKGHLQEITSNGHLIIPGEREYRLYGTEISNNRYLIIRTTPENRDVDTCFGYI